MTVYYKINFLNNTMVMRERGAPIRELKATTPEKLDELVRGTGEERIGRLQQLLIRDYKTAQLYLERYSFFEVVSVPNGAPPIDYEKRGVLADRLRRLAISTIISQMETNIDYALEIQRCLAEKASEGWVKELEEAGAQRIIDQKLRRRAKAAELLPLARAKIRRK